MIRKVEVNKSKNELIRERVQEYGLEGLLDRELIAFISGTDSKVFEAEGVESITEIRRNLQSISAATELQKQKIEAVFLIMERFLKHRACKEKLNINGPSSVYDYLKLKLSHLHVEHFVVIYLDTKNNIINDEVLSVGTVNASLVNPRELFIRCLENKSVSCIIAHNHPSSDVTPSREDISITKRIKEAGELIGIKLLDHVIIGEGYYSFKEGGLL